MHAPTHMGFANREAAVEGGESDMRLTAELMRFTIPFNMSGLPALTLPISQDADGKPVTCGIASPSLVYSTQVTRVVTVSAAFVK